MSAMAATQNKSIQDVFEETLTTSKIGKHPVKVLTLIDPESEHPKILTKILPADSTEPGAENGWTQKIEVLESACVKITITNLYSDTRIYKPQLKGKFWQNGAWHEDTITTATKCGDNGYVTYGTNAFGEFSMCLIRNGKIDQWYMSKSYTMRKFPAKRYVSTREYFEEKDLTIEEPRSRKRSRIFNVADFNNFGKLTGNTRTTGPTGSSP